MSELPHLDARGEAHMVDVGHKEHTHRRAVAQGQVRMAIETIELLSKGAVRKGDALAVARVAGIMAAKRTADLLPLCHPLALSAIQVELTVEPSELRVFIEATVEARDRTGVEMEALTAVSVAALCLYDMLKAVDKGMEIGGIGLVTKEGGQSGIWQRPVKVVPKSPPPPAAPPPAAPPAPVVVPPTTAPVVSIEPVRIAAPSLAPARVAPPSAPPPAVPAAWRREPEVGRGPARVLNVDGSDPRLVDYLRQKPVERAYMLGDLDPAYAEHCRWFALPSAEDETRLCAVLLVYQGLRMPAILTSGERGEDIDAIFNAIADRLPRSFHAQVRLHHQDALTRHFKWPPPTTMIRMGLVRTEYRPVADGTGVERIGHRDTASIMAIYKHYPDNFFDPAQLDTGLYCGIRAGGELVSLAGVHVFSKHYNVAAIGNIVTHTEHRGRGLATRCVRHLLDRLFDQVGHVALNVQADNVAAIACYRKFGFTERYRFVEGDAER